MMYSIRSKESLTNVDAAWLRMDDPTNLMMVTGLLLFEDRLDPDQLRTTLEERLLTFPRFRQRVVEAPLGLGMPTWQLDPRFDIGAHIHRVALPAPGDDAALQDLVSDLMSTPLDYTKPLWQVHLIEGYRGGCALLSRIHHCIADGIALVHVMFSLTDTSAHPPPHQPAAQVNAPPRAAPWLQQMGRALLQHGVETVLNPARALELAGVARNQATTLGKLVMLPPDPKTVLKGPLGVSKRAAWSSTIPLAGVKGIGSRMGGTINDVLLTAATGALRRYLLGRGEVVEDSMSIRAAIPVNLRPLDAAGDLGNRFGIVFLPLPVGIADPRRRLTELKRRMDELKQSPDALIAFGMLNAIGAVPSRAQPAAVEFFGSKATAVMTNVPGPREPLYLAGKQIRNVMFWVPQSGHLGLGLSIFSYAGGVMVGVASDAGLVPDPDAIVREFEAELKALMRRPRGGQPRKANH